MSTSGISLLAFENTTRSTGAPKVTSHPKKVLNSEVSSLRRWVKLTRLASKCRLVN